MLKKKQISRLSYISEYSFPNCWHLQTNSHLLTSMQIKAEAANMKIVVMKLVLQFIDSVANSSAIDRLETSLNIHQYISFSSITKLILLKNIYKSL